MSAPPDRDLLESIAADLGVDPSFVEKDWHATRLIAQIVRANYGALRPVFSGGTSLSKGFGLIKRFSEDLDFKVLVAEAANSRPARRAFREQVANNIRASGEWALRDADVHAADESRFVRCLVGYPAIFDPAEALRSQLKLEFTLRPPRLAVEERSIQSFVAQARQENAESPAVACVSPVETAADKLSALSWRVLAYPRDDEDYDPATIRHLHDLAALEKIAASTPAFPVLSHELLIEDSERARSAPHVAALAPAARVNAAIEKLMHEEGYRTDYERFVGGMSYAAADEVPEFDSAIKAMQRLCKLLPEER